MNTLTKITILVIVLIAIAFQAEAPAYADSRHSAINGHARNTVVVHVHTEKHTSSQTTISAPIMQDLTQCHLTFNGELVCVDVCGGMSTPGSICSFE